MNVRRDINFDIRVSCDVDGCKEFTVIDANKNWLAIRDELKTKGWTVDRDTKYANSYSRRAFYHYCPNHKRIV